MKRWSVILSFAVLTSTACTTTRATPDPEPTASTEPDECRCEDGCIAACDVEEDTQTTYRKVVRDADQGADEIQSDPPEAFALWEPRVSPLAPGALETLANAIGREPDSLLVGYRADFVRGRGEESAIVSETGELVIYRDDRPFATLSLGDPVDRDPVSAIQLVDDRAEVVVRHVVDGVERLTVCRVIGGAVARVFEIELTDRSVEFVHLGDERAIRVRDSEGTMTVYRWNQWEGMFRIPARAPTAP